MDEQNKIIYDVGLHKGEDTDYYLKKGFRVIGFEAAPDLVALCRQKFSDSIKAGKLVIVEGAIVDADRLKDGKKSVPFYKNRETSVWGTVVNEWAERNTKLGSTSEIIEVPVVDFSECLKQYGIPYYLKIDIEGMDTVCLRSLLNFQKRPDYISIESEKVDFSRLEEEFSLFTELGYDHFQMINQWCISKSKEPKKSHEGRTLNYTFTPGSSGVFGKDLNDRAWKNKAEALKIYKRIFRGYQLLGDGSKINQYKLGKIISNLSNAIFSYPGWHDTHARHKSVFENK